MIKKFLRDLGFIARVLVVILFVLTIHEYGHYSEFVKHDVEVEEFSFGVGPLLYGRQLNSGVQLSFRALPIMAYVKAKDNQIDKILKMSFWERFEIYVAGVRNNIFTGWVLVVGMQLLSVFRGRDWSDFFKDLFFTPIRIIILFFGFTVAFFDRWGTELVERYKFVVYGVEENEHINRILWWSFCLGFLNFLPVSGFDGSKIFLAPILFNNNNWWAVSLVPWLSTWLLLFLFVRGIRIGELVDYKN